LTGLKILVLIKREVKAFIKNPAFIIGLILMIGFYSFIGQVMGQSVRETVKELGESTIGVILEDDTPLTRSLLNLLNTSTNMFKGKIIIYQSIEYALRNTSFIIMFPKGFTDNATKPDGNISIYGITIIDKGVNIGSQSKIIIINNFRDEVEKLLPVAISQTYNMSIQPVRNIEVLYRVRVFGREMDLNMFNAVITLASLISLFLGIILGVNASYSAQLTAMEKVEKAFEMLLSQPVKRRDIVLAKIIGSSIASIIIGVVYLIAVFLMLLGSISSINTVGEVSSVSSQTPVLTTDFIGVDFIYVLIVTFIIGLIASGAVGLIIGSIVNDERVAGVLVAPVIFIFMGFGFVLFFIGITPEPFATALAGLTIIALPYSYILSVLTKNTSLFLYTLTSSILMTILLLTIAIVIFERDIIVTGLRFTLKRRE